MNYLITLRSLLFVFSLFVLPLFADELQNGFQTPPDSIRPGVYWYWINDNISKEGVVKDLEAMHEIGIGRAFIGNIGEQSGKYGSAKLLSDDWWDISHEALKTATRLGIEIGMFNSPGWSQSGGPWVKPERSMRYLAFSELKVTGAKTINEKIPAPGKDFQDVKTIAFKAPKNDSLSLNSFKPQISSVPKFDGVENVADGKTETVFSVPNNKAPFSIDFAVEKEFTARSIILKATAPCRFNLEIFVQENGEYRSVKKILIDRNNPSLSVGFIPFAPAVVSIPATTAKQFRLTFSNGCTFSEIEICSAPRVESYAEKELAKMWSTPQPDWGSYMWNEQPAVDDTETILQPENVIDISEFMKPDGTLQWDVPEGDWIIQRTGMLTTGVQNAPATAEAKGLEIDKMSKKHAAFHFDAFLGKVLQRIPEADRKSLKVVVQDSYETGGQNWTDDFIDEFQKVYGYNPVPFIPVLNGRTVKSQDVSDRFLWDLRRLIADKVAYDYVGGLREVAHKNGMTTWLECYGHWGFPGEFLQYGGQSDNIGGEFWNEGTLGNIENRAASSCGHIYGKTKITAESFTASGGIYERYPRLLKKRCDWSYTEGINESLLHLYIQQPYEDKTPGINAWFATEFNRKNTWFYHAKPFIDYMRRCMFMLQQGQNVADVAYFIGEDAPKMTGVCDPPMPKGYSFDYINGEVIRDKLSVKNGRLVLPHGTSYRLLVLPNQKTMRPETLRKIKQLVDDGACVIGEAPERSPSLQNYPGCDDEVAELGAKLYEKSRYKEANTKPNIKDVFDNFLRLAQDCVTDNPNTLYVHRTLNDGTEMYFLSNQEDKPITFSATFRVAGKTPELWDAVDGTMRKLPAFEQRKEVTTVPLKLHALGSAFIVFRTEGKPSASGVEANFPEMKTVIELDGAWEVQFDEAKRGPEKPQTFEKLIDWSTSEDELVKYYSGSATYKKTFEIENVTEGKKFWVNLGTVQAAAAVKVNGEEAGMLWTTPWQLDITKLVKKGTNTLEVEVVNTWINRLVGDARLPEAERKTWLTVNPFKPNSKLTPSGLLGPVRILSE
ncbi:MAG: hypothetical protein LBU65_16150 [Planctomycetaceae bacterium]|jgi:hypothetical protein|nr:hypothetical protein [Planctomycetaceae bacterium]